MKKFVLAVGFALLVTAAGPIDLDPVGAPPDLPPNVVVKTTFATANSQIADIGTAFIFDSEARGRLLVTALHVFGPPGGLDDWVAAADLPETVSGGEIRDAFTSERLGEIGAVVPTPDAHLPWVPNAGVGSDYAVFELEDADAFPAAMRRGHADVGDSIWIASPGLPDGPLFGGVREDGPAHLVSMAIPDDLQLPLGISGSPVLDRDGGVVGIVVMLGQGPDGGRWVNSTRIEDVVSGIGPATG